jgi:hypothetical protein
MKSILKVVWRLCFKYTPQNRIVLERRELSELARQMREIEQTYKSNSQIRPVDSNSKELERVGAG